MTDSKLYADRDHMELGDYYTRHVSAMTAEGLHAKSDIAAELAWRDREIARLRALSSIGDDDPNVLIAELRQEVARLRALSPAGGDVDRHWRDAVTEVLLEYADSEVDAPVLRDAIFLRVDSPPLAASPQQEPGAEVSSRGESCWHAEVGEGGDKVTCPDCKQTPAAAVDDCSIDATDNADYVEHCAAKLAKLGYLITGMTLSACAADYRARITSSGQALAGAGVVDLDLGQFREAVNCWRAVITTAAVNLPFNLAAYRASCGVSVPDRLLALIDSQAATSAGTTGDAEDAARYRWLRTQDWFNGPLCVLRDPKKVLTSGSGLGADCPSRDRLDEAIDAARRAREVG